jgi:hypothetical protein
MIIAIDPGPKASAFCFMEKDAISMCGKIGNEQLLEMLSEQGHNPIAIEMIASYGMPVGAEVFETCVWIGRFIQAHRGQHRFIYRKDVKMNLCKSMKANDSTIRQALVDRFGPKGTKANPGLLYPLKSDIWSAFAVGITAFDSGYGEGGTPAL